MRAPQDGVRSAFTLQSCAAGVKQILHISIDDVQVTRMIVEAGSLLNIDVLDHIIVTRQRFVSLKERGLGFK